MTITKITGKNPDRVKRKVLLDTDKLKEKTVSEHLEELNEAIGNKIDRAVGRICDLFG